MPAGGRLERIYVIVAPVCRPTNLGFPFPITITKQNHIVGKIWIPATILNIAFVKPALRVLYDNVIFLFWTIYLSMILNGDRGPPR